MTAGDGGPGTARPHRRDGVLARRRLLLTALRLFAEQGYANTSTREIAHCARVNAAAIAYYFDNKAGLYRAAFRELGAGALADPDAAGTGGMALGDVLTSMYDGLLNPLKKRKLARWALRIFLRELLEPTTLRQQEIDPWIERHHRSLGAQLAARLGGSAAASDVARLGFSLAGLAAQVLLMRPSIERIRPDLLKGPEQIDQWVRHMAAMAEAIVGAEVSRMARYAAAPTNPTTAPISPAAQRN